MNEWARLRQLRDVDVGSLVTLLALLRAQSVSGAAAKLGITQPAMSRALERLRAMLGDPLLVRVGNAMTLSPRARSILPDLEHVIEAVGVILSSEGPFDPASIKRKLQIACNEYTQIVLATAVVSHIAALAPGMVIRFVAASDSTVLRHLEDGSVDLMVAAGRRDGTKPALAVPDSLHDVLLYRENFVCLRRKDPAASGEALSLADFLATRHLDVAPSETTISVALLNEAAARHGGVRSVGATVSSALCVPSIVASADMVSFLPRHMACALPHHAEVELVELAFDVPEIDVTLYWHNVTHRDPPMQWLRGELTRCVQRAVGVIT
ncbi:MAG: LysR family transcriptional regulator [Burkholderiaceae bacterium]|nr:LysR family transcriptional regulator [Burkholderiaceae bacterium]